MPFLLRPPRRLIQTQGPVEIDWSHPLSRGLVFLVIPSQMGSPELVGGAAQNVLGTSTLSSGMDGVGLNSRSTTTGGAGYAYRQDIFRTISTDFTIAASLDINTLISNSKIVCAPMLGSSWNQPYQVLSISRNGTNSQVAVYIGTVAGGVSQNATFPVGTMTTGPGKKYIISRSGTSAWMVHNGVQYTPSSSTLTSSSVVYNTGGHVALLNRSQGTVGEGTDGVTQYAAIWNRALSFEEQARFQDSPYRILKPSGGRLYSVLPIHTASVPAVTATSAIRLPKLGSVASAIKSRAFYVRNGGNDSLDGLSDATAWATLNKASNVAFQPGDSVLLKRGSVWREDLFFQYSGTSSQPITVGAYGSGANPQIRGDNVVTGWTTEPPATVPAGENFTDGTGSKPLAWWMMTETSGNRASSAGSSDALVPSANPPTRGSGPHSYFSAEFNRANSQQFNLPESGMSANFPGRSGVANGSLTVGAWVRIDAETGSGGGIMGKGANWNLFIEGGSVRFMCFGPGFDGAYSSEEGVAYSAGVWRHYAGRIIRNATTGENELNLFVNGVKKPSAFAPDRDTSANDFTIGNAIFRSSLHGALAEVFVFAEALTDAQILEISTKGLDGTRTSTGPTLYYKGFATQPGAVFANDVPLQQASFKVEMSPGNQWWDSANLRQYVRLSGDADPATVEMSAAVRTFPVRMHSNSWWIVEDLHLKGAHQSNLFTSSASNGIVRRCTLSHAGKAGMHLYGDTGTTTGGIQVLDCLAHTNAAGGIEGSALGDGTSMSNITVSRNETHGNCWGLHLLYTGGIRFTGRPISNLTIEDNYVHDEGIDGNLSRGVGIWFDTTGAQSIGRRNRIERTTSWGIHIEDVDNAEAYSNLIVGSIHHPGIGVVRSCNGNKVYNNTIIDCAGGLDASNFGGANFLNNQFYNNLVFSSVPVVRANNGVTTAANASFNKNLLGPQAANFIEWNGMISTYAAWEAALGASTNSVQTDATFVNSATGNYRLAAQSSGISAGAPVTAGTLDYDGFTFNTQTPTIGAFEADPMDFLGGPSAVTLRNISVSAAGTASEPTGAVGTGDVRLFLLSGTGTVTRTIPNRTGSSAATLTKLSVLSLGTLGDSISRVATSAVLLKPVTATGAGTRTIPGRTGTSAVTWKVLTLVAAGTSGSSIARTGVSSVSLRVLAATGTATRSAPPRTATSAVRLPSLVHAAAGVRTVPGAIDVVPYILAPEWRRADFGNGSGRVSWRSPLDPEEKKAYTINCSTELSSSDNRIENYDIVLSGLAVLAGLRIIGVSNDNTNITLWFEIDPADKNRPNWQSGETHTLTCTIDVSDGQRFEREVSLLIKQLGQ